MNVVIATHDIFINHKINQSMSNIHIHVHLSVLTYMYICGRFSDFTGSPKILMKSAGLTLYSIVTIFLSFAFHVKSI